MHKFPHWAALDLRWTLVLASLLLTGCMSAPTPALQNPAPEQWSQTAGEGKPEVSLTHWWTTFKDPTLDALIQEALSHNMDLEQAQMRLRSGRIMADRWQSAFLPEISAHARTLQDVTAQDSYFHASLDMEWELGFFGGSSSEKLKASAETDLAQSRHDAVMVSVVAEVVRSYLDLGVAHAQMQRLRQTEALDSRSLKLAHIRQKLPDASLDELPALEQQRYQAQAAYAQARDASERAGRTLALLLGRAQADPAWQNIQAPPVLPDFSVPEVPADLLRTRPDIHLAEAEVMQAAAHLGLSRAALFPRLSLGASILYSYNLTQNVLTSTDYMPTFGPVIDVPLWDWGLRRARVKANEQELDAALVGYRKAVLTGVAEVENALGMLARQNERIAAYEGAQHVQHQQGQQLDTRIALGLASEFERLAWQRAQLAQQSDAAMAQAERSLAFVALYKALGGAPLEHNREEAQP